MHNHGHRDSKQISGSLLLLSIIWTCMCFPAAAGRCCMMAKDMQKKKSLMAKWLEQASQ